MENNSFKDILRGLFFAILLTFLLVVIFAAVVKVASLTEKTVAPVIIAIKIISVLFGVLTGIKAIKYGAVKGLIIGLLYTVFCFLIFSLLDGGFNKANITVYDFLFTAIAGIVSGVITVNVKKQS